MYDIAVIGGGVVGGLILREIRKFDLTAVLLEKENDVSMGASKANSGIVHAGYDAGSDTLKAKFNVLGNAMMKDLTDELGVKFTRCGSLVVAFDDEQMRSVEDLKDRGDKNGVPDMELLTAERLFEIEPNVSRTAVGALYAKSAGVVCPYELTIAAIGNAMDNGADLEVNFDVVKIEGGLNDFTLTAADGRSIKARAVVNCAGLGAEKVANLVGDRSFKIGARRGEYILIDRENADFVSHTLFFTPTNKGKDILITRTVDGNVLLGPTAEVIESGDTATTSEGLGEVVKKAKTMCDNVPLHNTITSFAGVRAFSDRHDFIIEESAIKKGFINCAGIESPGLTASPAIAKYVVNELIGRLFELKSNYTFDPIRKPDHFFKNLSDKEKNEIIKKDPAYGHIVCRCEGVTEGEIVRALTANPRATDVDGVKRRTRAGMGRCQGGFCQPYVAELIAKHLSIPLDKVTKCGAGSDLLTGRTK